MKYWWVNQKQTYSHEVPGGYMWSPKVNATGNHIRPYDLMRKVVPGDIVFSYANALLKAVGVVKSYCYEFSKPSEFVSAGQNCAEAGWRADVEYTEFAFPFKTIDYISTLRPFLIFRHSPLKRQSGIAGKRQESMVYNRTEKFEPLQKLLALDD